MENASKALIIAGAILLAISIIGIGMYVYQQAAGAMSGIGMDKEKIATYNSTFTVYEGTQNGASVRRLCEVVGNHNLANRDDASKQVKLQKGSAAGETVAPTAAITMKDINDIKKDIMAGKTYTIDFGYDANSGLIVAVGIRDK